MSLESIWQCHFKIKTAEGLCRQGAQIFLKTFGYISTNCDVLGSKRVVNGGYNDGPGRCVSLRDTPVLDLADASLTTRNLVVDDVLFSTPCNGR